MLCIYLGVDILRQYVGVTQLRDRHASTNKRRKQLCKYSAAEQNSNPRADE